MLESPNDTGSTGVDAAVSILQAAIEGIGRPEPIVTELAESIGDDFVNRLGNCTLIPKTVRS